MSNPENLRFSISILWCLLGFASYYFLSKTSGFTAKFRSLCKLLDMQGNQVLLQRALGLLFLGLLSALIIAILPSRGLQDFGLNLNFIEPLPWWSWLLIPVILILSYLTAKSPENLQQYPQIRIQTWTPGILIISSISWIVFIIGYEFLFRGFLLFASLEIMNPVPAISLNTAVYAFAHYYKGPGETFGSIPAGILFCYLTLLTGNIWTAVFLHTMMALSNEWFSLRSHPDMQFKRSP
jgi:membrane protease YdiL (CAAX protease family)